MKFCKECDNYLNLQSKNDELTGKNDNGRKIRFRKY